MRRLRVGLRTILVVVAFLAMAMGMVALTVRLQEQLRRSVAMEDALRAEAEREKALAQAQLAEMKAVLDAINAQSKKQQPQPGTSSVKP